MQENISFFQRKFSLEPPYCQDYVIEPPFKVMSSDEDCFGIFLYTEISQYDNFLLTIKITLHYDSKSVTTIPFQIMYP